MMFALVAMVTGAWAATNEATSYGFRVGGVLVTSENAENITGDGIYRGKVSYDVTTHTLTLDNAVIGPSGTGCIEGEGDNEPNDLTFRLIGENQLVEGYETAFYWWTSLSLTFVSEDGTGSLTTAQPFGEHSRVYGPSTVAGNLVEFTIDNCTVEVQDLWVYENGTLTVKNNGTLKVLYGIHGFKTRHFDDNIAVLQPEGAWWSTNGNLMVGEEPSSTYAEDVVIGPLTDNPSSIGTIVATRTDGSVYNLQGQRVERPAKGLYIVNGKKVVVK